MQVILPINELREKYAGGANPNARTLINKAIRAELVGGDHILTALDALRCVEHDWIQRGWTDGLADIRAARVATEAVAANFRAEIRRRYGMPPEADRE